MIFRSTLSAKAKLPDIARTTGAIVLLSLISVLLASCGREDTDAGKAPEMPKFDSPELAAGRSVWMGTCRNCHLMGVAEAPAVTDFSAWDPRLAKGNEALYQSALAGIKGEDGKYRMPPRGGNSRLTEDQVRKAVDYMAAAVKRFEAE